jgi:predicted DNA-binding protein
MENSNPRFLISLDPPVKQCLRQYTRRTGRTTTGFIRKIIYMFINEHLDDFAKEVDPLLIQKMEQKINQ